MGKRRRRRSPGRYRTLAIVAVVALTAVTGGLLIAVFADRAPAGSLTAEQIAEQNRESAAEARAEREAEAAARATWVACMGAASRAGLADCEGFDLGTDILPANPAKDTQAYCWTNAGDQPLNSCTYGSKSEDALRVALVGDSHARHLMPGLEKAATDWQIQSFFGVGCSLTTAPMEECATAGREALAALTTGEPFDVVLVSVSRRKRVLDAPVTEAIQMVQATGAKVIIVEDAPTTTPEAVECVQTAEDLSTCGNPRDGMKPDVMAALASTIPGVGVASITPYFCDDTWCPAVIGNVVVFVDDGAHMTATYSRTLGPFLVAAVEAARA